VDAVRWHQAGDVRFGPVELALELGPGMIEAEMKRVLEPLAVGLHAPDPKEPLQIDGGRLVLYERSLRSRTEPVRPDRH
jgi:hypothetical protein